MSTLKETVFVNRDNVIRLALYEDGILFQTAYPSVVPNRFVLTINSDPEIEVDSNSEPTAFGWDDSTSTLELSLGSILSTAMSYTPCTLVIYSSQWPDGICWFNPTCSPDKLMIRACTLT